MWLKLAVGIGSSFFQHSVLGRTQQQLRGEDSVFWGTPQILSPQCSVLD